MAFYLRRAFPEDIQEVVVYNDLRLVDAHGEVAQFDHLLLHRRGFIVIESKSVTSEIRINEHGEWSRKWNSRWQGMPSPIKQAQRQIEVLKNVLSANRHLLRGKLVGLQMGFANTPFDVLVAISDRGMIECDGARPPEVHKAESIVEEVDRLLRRHRRGLLNFNMRDGMEKYNEDEFMALINFISQSHAPLRENSVQYCKRASKGSEPEHRQTRLPSAVAEARDKYIPSRVSSSGGGTHPKEATESDALSSVNVSGLTCGSCGAAKVHVKFARTYYMHCLECGKNSPLNHPPCPTCGKPTKTRKQGDRFLRNVEGCDACDWQSEFHVNR